MGQQFLDFEGTKILANKIKEADNKIETLKTSQSLEYEGENVTCENTFTSRTSDVVVKGKTYQNLVNGGFKFSTSDKSAFKVTLLDNNGMRVERITESKISWQYALCEINTKLLKNNTQYTLMLQLGGSPVSGFSIKKGDSTDNLGGAGVDDSLGLKKALLTTNNTAISQQGFYVTIPSTSLVNVGDYLEISSPIILEGDWTNKEVPLSITGIESAGEKENKISILSHNKNYYPCKNDCIINLSNAEQNWFSLNGKPGLFGNIESKVDKDLIFFLDKGDYICTWECENCFAQLIRMDDTMLTGQSGKQITIDKRTKLTFRLKNTSADITQFSIKNIMIRKVNANSTYEPYKGDKKEILLPIQDGLKSLPNGTADTIEQRTDEVYLVQRVKKETYVDGDENNNNYLTDKVNTYKPLATPVETKLDINNLGLEIYKGITYVTTDNAIQPVLSFKVPSNLGGVLEENSKSVNELYKNVDKLDSLANENLLANSDFTIWNMGTSFSSNPHLTETANKWILSSDIQGASILKDTLNTGENVLKMKITENVGNDLAILQTLSYEDVVKLRGKRVTFSTNFKVEDWTSGNVVICVYTGTKRNDIISETGRIAFHKTITVNQNTGFQTHFLTTDTIQNNVESLTVLIRTTNKTEFNGSILNNGASIQVKNTKLEVGTIATTFIPKSYSEELLACNNGIIGSNPNLLINGDFRINQREQQTYTNSNGNKYTVDRWNCWSDNGKTGTIQKQDDGILCTLDNGRIRQAIELPPQMQNQYVTLSFEGSVTQGECWASILTSDSISDYTNNVSFGRVNWTGNEKRLTVKVTQLKKYLVVDFFAKMGGTIKLKWVKLELGSVATPFTPRPYGEELALCQRYYETTCLDDMFVGVREPNGVYRGVYQFKVNKRVAPTVTLGHPVYGDGKMYVLSRIRSEQAVVTPTNISETNVRISSDNLSTDTTHSCAFCGYVKADAEIY